MRIGGWRYTSHIGVVDVVVLAIQKFEKRT